MDALVEERWREERRTRLLEAAGRVFGKTAFERASMDEIAHEAGVGKPTLYRYFANKDALYLAVFVQALDDLEARLDRVLSETSGTEARLRGLLAEIVPTFRDHLVLVGGPTATADQSKRRVFRERRTRLGNFVADAILEGASRGELRAVSGELVAQFMIGMVRSAAANTDATDEQITQEVTDLLLNGLRPRSGSSAAPSRPSPQTPSRARKPKDLA